MSLSKSSFGFAVCALLLSACAAGPRAAHTLQPPASPSAMQRQIRNATDAGDGDYEIKLLRAKLEADPSSLSARLELARHYQRQGFPEVAIEHLRLAVERAPESPDAAIELAKMLRTTNRHAEAAVILSAFSTRHTPNVDTWAWLGLLRDESGDWKGGEIALREAIALAPVRDDLRNNLGWCLLRQGRKPEAADEFRRALRLNPRSVIARNNLGTSLADAPNEAVAHLQSVTDPASAHNNIAVALLEEGNYTAARQEIEIALSYNRQNTAALNNLRLLSELDGKPVEISAAVPDRDRWARLHRTSIYAAWRRLRGLGPQPVREQKNSGSNVASR